MVPTTCRLSALSRASDKRTLILGTTPLARELVAVINNRGSGSYSLLGVVRESSAGQPRSSPCPVLGSLESLERIVAEYRPACIIVALAERRGSLPVQQLIAARLSRGIRIENGEDVYERLAGKVATDSLRPSNVIFSRDFQPPVFARVFARGASLLAAAAGLLVFAPLFVLIALAIKCDSRGPVLFVQDRIGLRGRPFRMMKFRTMHPDEGRRSEWVRDNDDRITRIGRWLRRFRLDELPQFINILRGDMNLVGPRPHPLSNYQMLAVVSRNLPECGEQIPYYLLRSMVRPGITGWAQVRYRYANNLNEEMEKLRYDLYYIKHYSIRLDLQVLLETVVIVLLGGESKAPDGDTAAEREEPALPPIAHRSMSASLAQGVEPELARDSRREYRKPSEPVHRVGVSEQ